MINTLKRTLILFLSLGFFALNLNAQDVYKYYSGNLGSKYAGNPNVVYDSETDHYFFIEWQRDITLSQLGAFNIKKIDADGNFISSQYFPTDSHPYSAHYISDIEIQGDDIVLFFNRNISEQYSYHDSFIIRFNKNLSGTYESTRYFYPTGIEGYYSIKIMDSKKMGNKIIFTGNISQSPDDQYAKLLIGVIHEDKSIQLKTFQTYKQKRIVGLNVHTINEENEFYIGGAVFSNSGDKQYPLIVKASLNKNNQINIFWSNVYYNLTVDTINLRHRIKGVKVPIVDRFKPYDKFGFFSRDSSGQHLVLTLFSGIDGEIFSNVGFQYTIPEDVVLIDAIKYSDGKKNSFMVLFNKKENSNVINTSSYIFHVNNFINGSPSWHDMNSVENLASALARKFIDNTDKKVAIGLLGNTTEFSWDYEFSKSVLFTSDDYNFYCLNSISLEKYSIINNIESKIVLYKSSNSPYKEDRIIDRPLPLTTTEVNLCIQKEAHIIDTIFEKDNSEIDYLPRIKTYPNPAKDIINIDIPSNLIFKSLNIKITNIAGSTVLKKLIYNKNKPIDISNLNPGIYFIQILGNHNLIHTQKLIVQ